MEYIGKCSILIVLYKGKIFITGSLAYSTHGEIGNFPLLYLLFNTVSSNKK